MKFMHPEIRLSRLSVSLFLIATLCLPAFAFQAKKPPAKKPAAKTPAKTAVAKNTKPAAKAPAKTTAAAKKAEDQKKKPAAKTAVAQKKQTPAQRRAEAARKKKEEERRQAALAEQRRREQAAREARARKLAFERGLKDEAAANILRDSTEGEDLRIRRVAVSALGDRAGTVVVMDAVTGRILTMVNQEWGIRHGFKPCSTIKLVTGVAGLNENLINPGGTIIGNSMQMTLDDALAYSNNVYFQRVGVQMGTDTMIDYARRLGLGQRTGINADREYAGRLPYGNKNPRIYSHADDFEVTPLQLAVMVTAITNGGRKVVPQMNREHTENVGYKSIFRGEVSVPYGHVQGVIPGMMGAAEYGTARRGVDPSKGIAGKTGSCIEKGSWVGLFASVAPVEDPKYSVVVITRGEGERGRIAAGIAHQIYAALGEGIRRDPMKTMALRQIRTTNASEMRMARAVETDEDEEDEDDVAASTEAGSGDERPIVIGPANTVQPDAKKLVTRTVSSRPVQPAPNFKPVVIEYKKDNESDAATPPEQKVRPRVVDQ